jgi:hypothetical protein
MIMTYVSDRRADKRIMKLVAWQTVLGGSGVDEMINIQKKIMGWVRDGWLKGMR